MIGCNTHFLKHMKQAMLVWLFRQNIFLGCYPEKTSKIGRAQVKNNDLNQYLITSASLNGGDESVVPSEIRRG